MTDRIPRASVAALSLLLPVLAISQTETETGAAEELREYTVEIILFRYADSVSAGTEVFVPDPLPLPEASAEDELLLEDGEIPVFSDASTGLNDGPMPLDADGDPLPLDEDGTPLLLDEDGNPVVDKEPLPPRANYVLMIDDELTLGTTWDQLERLGAYEPFAHFGWAQQLRPYEDPIAIGLADLMPAEPGLNGAFTLYLSRFLHLVVDLAENADRAAAQVEDDMLLSYGDDRFIEPIPYDSYALSGPTFYRINEDRIFKSGDLRYFDHPRFGVLAKIERVEKPDPEEEQEEDGSLTQPVDLSLTQTTP